MALAIFGTCVSSNELSRAKKIASGFIPNKVNATTNSSNCVIPSGYSFQFFYTLAVALVFSRILE